MGGLWGFADIHCHPMANLAFGDRNFLHGRMDAPIGDLTPCDGRGHGVNTIGSRGVISMLETEHEDRAHGHSGSPNFNNWPSFKSRTHQQMHIDWIRRAFDGGLRLMVALAVDNSFFRAIRLYDPPFNIENANNVRRTAADDWNYSSFGQQLRAIQDIVENNPMAAQFMEIALTPEDARRIINSRKLAVVLGVEVDNLIASGVGFEGFKNRIASLFEDLNVRHIFPIHLTDNWFGGASVNTVLPREDLFNTLNHYLTGVFWSIVDGGNPDPDDTNPLVTKEVQFRLLPNQKIIYFWWNRYFDLAPVYSDVFGPFQDMTGHINEKGLTEIGQKGIQHLMSRGMIIDIDHMSQRTADGTLKLAEQIDYPVVSGHSTFRELKYRRTAATDNIESRTLLPSETDLSRKQVVRIAKLGGMVAPVTNPSIYRANTNTAADRVVGRSSRRPGTSRSWAQAYLYAVENMGGRGGVAFGTDFNGLNGKPGPRFVPYNEYHEDSGTAIAYNPSASFPDQTYFQPLTVARPPANSGNPLDACTAVNRRYNFNIDGLAHYGLLPDLIQDVKNLGLTGRDLEPLFRSAEAYITMWEKCRKQSTSNLLNDFR